MTEAYSASSNIDYQFFVNVGGGWFGMSKIATKNCSKLAMRPKAVTQQRTSNDDVVDQNLRLERTPLANETKRLMDIVVSTFSQSNRI